MAELTKPLVEQALSTYQDPYLKTDLISSGTVQEIHIQGSQVEVDVCLNYPAGSLVTGIAQLLQVAVENLDGCSSAKIKVNWLVKVNKPQNSVETLSQVKNIIAVSSAKGGVGKSTTTVNLAIALAKEGAKVGLLDADIYGPSQGLLLGVEEGTRPETIDNKMFVPVEAHGVKSMSMAYLVTEATPMVWRGPMVSGALMQIMTQTQWGELDYLLIDMPPGTGDIQLTLSQKIPVSGAVIVTTPQDVALIDAKKGIEMFAKVKIPVLGMIENMSLHICSSCGHVEHIFGEDGVEQLASSYQTSVLGSLPLSKHIRIQSDAGTPVVAFDETSEVSALYRNIARQLAVEMAKSGNISIIPTFEVTDD